MKKIRKAVSWVLLSTMLGITVQSCTSKKEIITNNVLLQENLAIMNERIFSHEEMIEVGKKHNKYLLTFYNPKIKLNDTKISEITEQTVVKEFMEFRDFEWNDSDSKNTLKYVIKQVNSLSEEEYSRTPLTTNLNFSLEVRDFIQKLDVELEKTSSIPKLSNFVFKVTDEIRRSNLSISEKNALLGYAYIMEASATLWAPKNIGGQGFLMTLDHSVITILK